MLRRSPKGAPIVVAGESEGCSGKANTTVIGMEAATHDLVIWTDDDFHHPPDWLDQPRADYEQQGPTTEIPLFVGRDLLSYLLEPLYAQVSLFIATPAGNWGGALIFDRTEDVDEEALLAELQQIISDDATVNEHIEVTTAQRTRRAEIGGSVRASLELHTRFQKIPWRHGSKLGGLAGALLTVVVAVVTLVFPVLGFAAMTLVYGGIYARLGFSRWTVLLSYLSVLLTTPLWVYAITRRTFVWGAVATAGGRCSASRSPNAEPGHRIQPDLASTTDTGYSRVRACCRPRDYHSSPNPVSPGRRSRNYCSSPDSVSPSRRESR